MRPLRVLTWYGQGNYLRYLARVRAEFIVPVPPVRFARARLARPRLGPNVIEVPEDLVRGEHVDCVIYPSRDHFEEDGLAILTPTQRRRLPRIYLEPDPPDQPVAERHWSDDPDGLLVFVTPFASVAWDAGRTPGRLIEHGVHIPESCRYRGHLARGVAVLAGRTEDGDRRAGLDLLERIGRQVPIDRLGPDGPPNADWRRKAAAYRFAVSPARWGGLSLAVVESLAAGQPVVGLASAELAAVVRSGETGVVEADSGRLVDAMRELLRDPALARRLGDAARTMAADRFGLDRFVRDWEDVLTLVTGRRPGRIPAVAVAA